MKQITVTSPDICNKMRHIFEHKPILVWVGRTGLYVTFLAVSLAGCASMSKTVPQPAKPVTVSASLQNDPYPDIRQLNPQQAKQLQTKRDLVNQLATPGAQQGPAPQKSQAPAPIVTGTVRPRRLDETATQQSVPQNPQAQPLPQNAPQQKLPAPSTQVAAQVKTPDTPANPPRNTKAKSGGFWSWLGPISAQRASEATPAQKLRRSRELLASQRQEIDQAQIINDGTGPAATVPPAGKAGSPPTQIAHGPTLKAGVKPEKPKTALRITKPSKPSRIEPKPHRVATKRVRRPAPRARAVKREPVQVARLGSNTRPITTASVPARTTQVQPASKIRSDLPTRSRPVTVYFSKDSSELSPRDAKRLRELAGLQQSSGKRVHVRAIAAAGPNGETSADANDLNKLAVSRAKAVAKKLWGFGVKSSDMVLQASQEQAAGQGRSTLQAARIRRAEIYIE